MEVEEEQIMTKISISYSTTCYFWSDYNLNFGAREYDMCEICFDLKTSMNRLHLSTAEKNQYKKAFFDHQYFSSIQIDVRKKQKQNIENPELKIEHLEIYFRVNP